MATLESIEAKLNALAADVAEIKADVKAQNGRVRELERCQAVTDERLRNSSIVTTGIAALMSAVAGYIGVQFH